MYRDPKGAPTTTCARCRASVLQSETFFTTDGDLVCVRCHGIENAHAQVERGRDAEYENAGRGIVGMLRKSEADDAAFRDHGEIQAIAGYRMGAPLAASPDARCELCEKVVPRVETTYALPSGALVCRPCEAITLAAIAEARARGSRTMILGLVVAAAIGLTLVAALLLLAR